MQDSNEKTLSVKELTLLLDKKSENSINNILRTLRRDDPQPIKKRNTGNREINYIPYSLALYIAKRLNASQDHYQKINKVYGREEQPTENQVDLLPPNLQVTPPNTESFQSNFSKNQNPAWNSQPLTENDVLSALETVVKGRLITDAAVLQLTQFVIQTSQQKDKIIEADKTEIDRLKKVEGEVTKYKDEYISKDKELKEARSTLESETERFRKEKLELQEENYTIKTEKDEAEKKLQQADLEKKELLEDNEKLIDDREKLKSELSSFENMPFRERLSFAFHGQSKRQEH